MSLSVLDHAFIPDGAAAVDGTDFTARPNTTDSTVILPAGARMVRCDLEILESDESSGDRVFDVVLTGVSRGGTLGTAVRTTVTITGNLGMFTLIINSGIDFSVFASLGTNGEY